MQQFNCLIVEDEPLAAEVLQDYVKQVPFLSLAGVCADAIYALELLQKQPVDVIFLDIHLPKLKGFDFLKTLKNPPAIIITSAYHEYALLGYEFNVVDYLLKPVEFSRFLMAVNKLRFAKTEPATARIADPEKPSLFFNVNKKKVRIFLDEILYIESLKEYVRIVTTGRTILTKFALGQVEDLLAKNNFLRVHRSFIVAKNKIEAFTATDVEIGGQQIPIGRSYKDLVMAVLDGNA